MGNHIWLLQNDWISLLLKDSKAPANAGIVQVIWPQDGFLRRQWIITPWGYEPPQSLTATYKP